MPSHAARHRWCSEIPSNISVAVPPYLPRASIADVVARRPAGTCAPAKVSHAAEKTQQKSDGR